jgi:hypothetical protein
MGSVDHSKLTNGVRMSLSLNRFWKNVDIREVNECWPYKRKAISGGYPLIFWYEDDFVQGRAYTHRVAYEWAFGNAGVRHVKHRCDNKRCCNPAHLYTIIPRKGRE